MINEGGRNIPQSEGEIPNLLEKFTEEISAIITKIANAAGVDVNNSKTANELQWALTRIKVRYSD